MLDKKLNFAQKHNVAQKSQCCSKIEILVKLQTVTVTLKFVTKIWVEIEM